VSTAPRAVLVALALLVSTVVPAAAEAGQSALLWSTVNVCDTPRYPDRLGLRGSMPGNGLKGEMFMRFRVQYFNRKKQRWRTVSDTDADSCYMSAGSSRFKVRQTGATFHLAPPQGGSWTLRGMVDYEWRLKGRVIKRAKRFTEEGRKSVSGADPPGFSASECEIS
jgi:hypothetical protein